MEEIWDWTHMKKKKSFNAHVRKWDPTQIWKEE
jgi:hypothetical protein